MPRALSTCQARHSDTHSIVVYRSQVPSTLLTRLYWSGAPSVLHGDLRAQPQPSCALIHAHRLPSAPKTFFPPSAERAKRSSPVCRACQTFFRLQAEDAKRFLLVLAALALQTHTTCSFPKFSLLERRGRGSAPHLSLRTERAVLGRRGACVARSCAFKRNPTFPASPRGGSVRRAAIGQCRPHCVRQAAKDKQGVTFRLRVRVGFGLA